MIDIGINYIKENSECYKLLKEFNYINTLKFPGKTCDEEELNNFISFVTSNDFKIDLHGLPGMKPAFSCDNLTFRGNLQFNKLQQLFGENTDIYRFSTHIGIDNKDRIANYEEKQLEKNWNENYNFLKKNLTEIFKQNVDIGLENIPGGFDFDKKTLIPEYVSENWKKADFGVFDIAHAKLSAKDLNMEYSQYLNKLKNKEKVKILHISGNHSLYSEYANKPDKHVLINTEEFDDIINTLEEFDNLDLVVSEYAYNSLYSSKKETIIEAVTINTLVKYRNIELSKKIFNHIRKVLEDDISNIKEVLNKLKSYLGED